jgi:nucleoside-diphosphate-sugar epimerase
VRRVLVTGAAGFVGANLARRLVFEGHEVHVLGRPGFDRWRLESVIADVSPHEIDLLSAAAVRDAVAGIRPEWVFHLAARGGYSWQDDVDDILRTNVLGTSNLLAACAAADVEVLVNTGSSSEYGLKDHAPREDERLEPNSPYAVAKAAATMLCSLSGATGGMRVVTLRLYSVYGPYEEPGRLVPTLAAFGLEGGLPPLVSPQVARDFVWIDDVADAYLAAAAVPVAAAGVIFNVGTGRQTTVANAVEVARRSLAIAEEPVWGAMAERAWDTETWVADPGKIERELGWRATVGFDDGFERVLNWLRERPELRRRYVDGLRR